MWLAGWLLPVQERFVLFCFVCLLYFSHSANQNQWCCLIYVYIFFSFYFKQKIALFFFCPQHTLTTLCASDTLSHSISLRMPSVARSTASYFTCSFISFGCCCCCYCLYLLYLSNVLAFITNIQHNNWYTNSCYNFLFFPFNV